MHDSSKACELIQNIFVVLQIEVSRLLLAVN